VSPLAVHGTPSLRLGLMIVGALLIAATFRGWGERGSSRSARTPPPSAVVRCSVRVCRRTGMLRRSSDATLATRLAAAPRCWPARAVALAIRDAPAEPPELASAMPGVRLVCAAVLGLAAGGTLRLTGPVAASTLALGAAWAGVWLPDVVLARAARRAFRSADRDATAAVDVLAAAVSAGVPLHDAFELTAGHSPPPVAASLRAAALSRLTGAEPRAALAAEAERFHVPVLTEVGEAVDRQRRLGTPLAFELRRIAARRRAEDRARLLEHAARRGPLGTLVVALVIAPVCLAALTACLVGGLIESGGLAFR
jgi:Flp pilus assembly protein TadB